jgi:hypothetical protein
MIYPMPDKAYNIILGDNYMQLWYLISETCVEILVMLQVKYIRDGSTPEVRAWAAWTRGGFFW